MTTRRRLTTSLPILVFGLCLGGSEAALSWGATGPEWVSAIAVEKLPNGVPSFIRTPEAAAKIAIMGRELDRSKGSGKTHDAERDPGDYVGLTDDASVEVILPLSERSMPTRLAYSG
ncbi:hypothetical protein [Reyranella sp.]|uniref:hypothetical protein n=1 Tax=Reyranella sp. TaxID=1929291 RepID=UPI002716B6D3|nr:hypothetical protein [Reyranella sp.]MDO8977546.1 hypothetical protein [Reyranella sp.]